MATRVEIRDADGYLLATQAGDYSLADSLAHMERVAAVTRERKLRRVVFDITRLVGDVPDMDRFEIGKEAAEIFQHVDRVAIVMAGSARSNGFALDVAANRGLDMRSFVSAAEAIDWVKGA